MTGFKKIQRWLFPALLLLLSPLTASANKIITAVTCSNSDIQNAINFASDGDTIKTPGPCIVAFSATVSFPGNKGITVDGGGTTTVTTAYAFDVQSSATTSSRLTGFIFTNGGNTNSGDVRATGTPTSAPFRIDHNIFTAIYPTGVATWNNAPGVIDHNSFTGGAASEMIHNMALGASTTAGWTDDLTPGSSAMVFIEDNTFTDSSSGVVAAAVQSYYGARTVIRHNTLVNGAFIDQHGTPHSIGARWWEIYNNTFVTNGVNIGAYMQIRAGSGLIYNNHIVGANPGSGSLELWEEDTGAWPLAFQIGSGINGQTDQHSTCSGGTLNSSPVYLWGNDSGFRIYGTPGSLIQQNRDFFISASQPSSLLLQERASDTCSTTYKYTPYTYPHPLVSGTVSSVSPPTNLAAVVQ